MSMKNQEMAHQLLSLVENHIVLIVAVMIVGMTIASVVRNRSLTPNIGSDVMPIMALYAINLFTTAIEVASFFYVVYFLMCVF